jgi:hypothetical protein
MKYNNVFYICLLNKGYVSDIYLLIYLYKEIVHL